MIEEFYFTISIDRISAEDAQKLIDLVIEMRGSMQGMSVSYAEPI